MARQPLVPVELRTGLFTLETARLAGLSRRQLAGQSWRRIERGIYCWAQQPDTTLLRLNAVALRLPAAVFSGRTAGWLHGLDLPATEPIEVTVENVRASARAGIRVHRGNLGVGEVIRLKCLKVTSGLRTAVDLGSRKPIVDAVIALDMALNRRLVSLAQLRGVSGPGGLRRAIELAEPATQSPMETRLRLLLIFAGLPRPQAQVSIRDPHGVFLGRPDLYYPEHQLGLEYDGGTHRDSLVEDNRRQNRLLNGGIRLLRFTAADIFRAPESVINQVRLAISKRGP